VQSVSGFDYTIVSLHPTPQIKLLNNQGASIGFSIVPEATDRVDRAMDAMSTSDSTPADIYFV
jgi:hypothetical protein